MNAGELNQLACTVLSRLPAGYWWTVERHGGIVLGTGVSWTHIRHLLVAAGLVRPTGTSAAGCDVDDEGGGGLKIMGEEWHRFAAGAAAAGGGPRLLVEWLTMRMSGETRLCVCRVDDCSTPVFATPAEQFASYAGWYRHASASAGGVGGPRPPPVGLPGPIPDGLRRDLERMVVTAAAAEFRIRSENVRLRMAEMQRIAIDSAVVGPVPPTAFAPPGNAAAAPAAGECAAAAGPDTATAATATTTAADPAATVADAENNGGVDRTPTDEEIRALSELVMRNRREGLHGRLGAPPPTGLDLERERRISAALDLDLDATPRMRRDGSGLEVELHDRKQASELLRYKVIVAAVSMGLGGGGEDRVRLAYEGRERIAEAAARLVAYDYGYRKTLGRGGNVLKWYDAATGSVATGVVDPIRPAHRGSKPKETRAVVVERYRDFANVPVGDGGGDGGPPVKVRKGPGLDKKFPVLLHQILSRDDLSDVVSWAPHGRAWRLVSTRLLEERILPQYFAATRYDSFHRQVLAWGFRRVTKKGAPDEGCFYHELFLRGLPHLAARMRRDRYDKKGGRLTDKKKNKLAEKGELAFSEARKSEHVRWEEPDFSEIPPVGDGGGSGGGAADGDGILDPVAPVVPPDVEVEGGGVAPLPPTACDVEI